MGLLNLKTDLKSLKYGNDRLGGGSSGQPYITTPIDKDPQTNIDFLLNGGIQASQHTIDDTKRLTKFFTDLKSPKGILFTAKQNLLSRTGVETQASRYDMNDGFYTPLSTLAQTGIGILGGHVPKQGIIPLLGAKTYSDVIKGDGVISDSIVNKNNNRLVTLYNKHKGKFSGADIISYPGGPNSSLGIGNTNIRFSTDSRGGIIKTLGNDGYTEAFIKSQTGISNSNTDRKDLPSYSPLTSRGITTIFKNEFNLEGIEIGLNNGNDGKLGFDFQTSVYNKFNINDDSTFPLQSTNRISDNNTSVWDQERIEGQTNENNSQNVVDPKIQDFREPLLSKIEKKDSKNQPYSTIMGIAPSYNNPSIDTNTLTNSNKETSKVYESRVHIGDPGKQGNVYNYTKGKRNLDGTQMGPLDKISSMPIYRSNNVTDDITKNDLIKFRIGAIGDTPIGAIGDTPQKDYIHFRAFIDSFSDSYSAEWSSTKYMGRGESFYKYGGFDRKISLSFTVAAQSREELIPIYKKLNFLASNLAPTYSDKGYMGGPLITLTLGGWCYELPGFISSLTLDIPEESPWEIAIPASKSQMDKNNPIYSDKGVKELPHIIKVSGFSFTPIHTFRPAKQVIDFNENGSKITKYGPERYIALENRYNTNYDITP